MTGERTVTLAEAREELDNRLDELAAEYDEAESGSDHADLLEREAADVEQQLAGVAHLLEHHDGGATVRITGLTAEDHATARNVVADLRASTEHENVPGSANHIYAAVGLEAAPFLEEASERPGEDGLDATLRALGEQPPGVARWLSAQVDSLTGGDGEFRGFAERLQDHAPDDEVNADA